MLSLRLQERCPSAQAVGLATANDFSLCFGKRSIDGSGKGAIRQASQATEGVHGVLFQIDHAEIARLDKAEGAPRGYTRDEMFQVVRPGERATTSVTTYLPNKVEIGLNPYDWYHALVIAGAQEHQLPAEYIRWLQQFSTVPDPKPDRPQRIEALNILDKVRL